MMMIWHPLQNDFLREGKSGDIREDRVILGSRRIYDPNRHFYTNTHVFVIPEKRLFERYEGEIDVPETHICILDRTGGLLSSSRKSWLPTASWTVRSKRRCWNAQRMNLTGMKTVPYTVFL